MAFRQPTVAPTSRPTTAHEPNRNAPVPLSSNVQRDLQESHEWILFPVRLDAQTPTTSTECTPQTARLSRLSDFGSLTGRSKQDEGIFGQATNGSTADDEELDSLDEGLHAFQEPHSQFKLGYFDQSGSILPRHDGLGTFPASGHPIQEQIWHFEQCNPRKRSISGHQRRRSSVQRRLDAIEDSDAAVVEEERRERIEKWRMEQSRVLLDEIEKQTRRRRRSTISQQPDQRPSSAGPEQVVKELVDAQINDLGAEGTVPTGSDTADTESFWQRFTRRVIRDFIGLDDNLLSVIFGESLPQETPAAVNPSSRIGSSKLIRLDTFDLRTSLPSWEGRLLDRIARELGMLVQHISDHPGAFSTSLNPSTIDYAGMPITVPTSSKSQLKPSLPDQPLGVPSSPSFDFNPTLPNAPLLTPTSTAESQHAALWGIEEEPNANTEQENRDYWEQAPDLKTVFRFLHKHFTASPVPSSNPTKPAINIATTSTPESLRRAAIIRQHHPVVSRAAAAWDQRHGHSRRYSLLRGRRGSSCAGSLVASARRVGLRAGSLGSSSRNYWDIGGSTMGSGGAGAIGGGMLGVWGEV